MPGAALRSDDVAVIFLVTMSINSCDAETNDGLNIPKPLGLNRNQETFNKLMMLVDCLAILDHNSL